MSDLSLHLLGPVRYSTRPLPMLLLQTSPNSSSNFFEMFARPKLVSLWSLKAIKLPKSKSRHGFRSQNLYKQRGNLCCSLYIGASSSSQADEASAVWPYLSPLLLSFYASQKRSSFAARSLVQCVIELYMAGQDWNDIQIELKLSGMQESKFIEQLESPQEQKRARIQMEFEKDCLLQWMMLVFLTLHELGIPQMIESAWFKETFRDIIEGTKETEDGEQAPVQRDTFSRAIVGDGLHHSASRLLLAFMGAAHGSYFSVNSFIQEAFLCYRKGWSAQEVFDAIALRDFACGQVLFPVATGQEGGNANAEVFSQWLSAVFITLAQVGLPRPEGANDLGWAVADVNHKPDAIAANQLAHFITTSLRQQEEARSAAMEQNSEATQAVKNENPVFRSELQPPSFAVLQDESLRSNSSAIALMSQLLEVIRLTSVFAKDTMKLNP